MLISINEMDKVQALATALAEFDKAVCDTLDGQLIHIGQYTITVQLRDEMLEDKRAEHAKLSRSAGELLATLRNACLPDFPWQPTKIELPMHEHVNCAAASLRGRRLNHKQ